VISGVYKIQNSIDGKVYIGSAANLRIRTRKHLQDLKRGDHSNKKLQNAWNKYGESTFEFYTLLICSKENLLMYEQLCIDGFDAVKSGYNICPTAGNTSGRTLPQEARSKISAAHKGNKYCVGRKQTEKVKEALLAANVGRKLSDSHKAKISAVHKGNKHTLGIKLAQNQKEALLKANIGNKYRLGIKHTEETRARMSASKKGRKGHPASTEARVKIGNANRVRVVSDETRAKMSASQKVRQEMERQKGASKNEMV
jgi:group I intron endonuclease